MRLRVRELRVVKLRVMRLKVKKFCKCAGGFPPLGGQGVAQGMYLIKNFM
jgi:hypothetical protein